MKPRTVYAAIQRDRDRRASRCIYHYAGCTKRLGKGLRTACAKCNLRKREHTTTKKGD